MNNQHRLETWDGFLKTLSNQTQRAIQPTVYGRTRWSRRNWRIFFPEVRMKILESLRRPSNRVDDRPDGGEGDTYIYSKG